MTVVELQDDAFIASVLEEDRIWSAYALCDLDEPYRSRARFLGLQAPQARGFVLLYTLERFTAIVPCGDSADVRRVLEGARDIPCTVFLQVRDADLPAVEARFRVLERWQMLRMSVEVPDLQAAPQIAEDISPLGQQDAKAIRALYARYGQAVFETSMLADGFYQGVWDGGALIAVAGIHAVSRRFRIATIGGVFTHPEYRCRGLGTALTEAVGLALKRAGITTLALNVRADNVPAIAAYTRLGFGTHTTFWEGYGELRDECN